jgi:F0F1-type ATP synthase assembly protein I
MESLDHLKKKITKIKSAKDIKRDILKNKLPMSFRVCIEIASAIIAGLIIGGILDYLFGTKWIFKIISLILGCVASFRVLYNLMVNNK